MRSRKDCGTTSGYHGRKQAAQLRQVAAYCRPETVRYLDLVKDSEKLDNRGQVIDTLVARAMQAEREAGSHGA